MYQKLSQIDELPNAHWLFESDYARKIQLLIIFVYSNNSHHQLPLIFVHGTNKSWYEQIQQV